jgi:hypothetical protein
MLLFFDLGKNNGYLGIATHKHIVAQMLHSKSNRHENNWGAFKYRALELNAKRGSIKKLYGSGQGLIEGS